MILLDLTIKNFLSYSDTPQTISFQGESIICLSGNNGHGKSALLESITWCLWGVARKNHGVTKNDESLMRLGSSEMLVSVLFSSRNKKYLVARSCEKKYKKTLSDLSLYLYESEDKKTLLNGANQKETQEIINTIIGVDYDMFTNTSFLRQGNSNEFSKKTPKERKELLSKILQVDRIEELREKVLIDLKKYETDMLIIKKHRESIFDVDHTLLEDKKNIFTEIKKIYHEKKTLHDTLQKDIITLETSHKEYINQLFLIDQKQHTVRGEYEKIYHEYQKAYRTYQDHKKKHSEYTRYIKEQNTQQIEKNNEQEILLKNKRQSIINNEQIFQKDEQKILQELTLLLHKKKHEYENSTNLIEKIKKNINTLNETYKYYEQSHIENTISLPFVINTIKKLIQYKKLIFYCHHTKNKNRLDMLYKKKIPSIEHITLSLENLFNESHIIFYKKQNKEYEENIESMQKNNISLLKDIESCEKNIKEHTQETKSVYASYAQQKKEYEEQYATYLKERDIYKSIQMYINEMEKTLLPKKEFHTIRNSIKSYIQHIRAYKKTIILYESMKKEIRNNDISQLEEKKQLYILCDNELQDLYKKMVEHNAIIQCLEKQDEENKKTRLILDETYEKKSEEYTIYNNFATLLNRDNLQATLIDEYIPVIEEEANNILHKLSDGRCSLSMESTRDLKSGKSKETLDIIVVDNAGSRPYEFFSGGEAFRIDLAIRIGLSKVLARQAGVTLKTLIIDEGFGSQDGTSLETVMHSIYSLQSDFDLIIIVSHLSSMKEQFPVHLVVTKTSSGSIIKTIGK